MNQPVMFKINQAGDVTFLVGERTKGFVPEATTTRRASHVVPLFGHARFWFKALRMVFGEDGRVGDWTRTWTGPWIVDLRPVGGNNGMIFMTREQAIDFEIAWLNQNFLGV